MRLGLSSYAFGHAVAQGRFDENDLLDRARDLGVSLVQFGDHIPLVDFGTGRLMALKARRHDWRIEVQVGGRGMTHDNLERHIRLCERLGANLLRFVIDDPGFEPDARQVIQIVDAHEGRLVSQGITLGIENHDRFPARVLRQIIEEVDSSNVGICLDTANSLGAGEGLNEVLQVLAPLAVNLHIKDFHIARVPNGMGFTVEGRPAGSGMLDVLDLLTRVGESKRCASAILETWVPMEPDTEQTLRKEEDWARESMKYLRSLEAWA